MPFILFLRLEFFIFISHLNLLLFSFFSQLFLAFHLSLTFFISKKIISLFAFVAISFILVYYKTHISLMLKFDFFLLIIILVNENILLIADILSSIIFCIFLIYVNKILTISSSLIFIYVSFVNIESFVNKLIFNLITISLYWLL